MPEILLEAGLAHYTHQDIFGLFLVHAPTRASVGILSNTAGVGYACPEAYFFNLQGRDVEGVVGELVTHSEAALAAGLRAQCLSMIEVDRYDPPSRVGAGPDAGALCVVFGELAGRQSAFAVEHAGARIRLRPVGTSASSVLAFTNEVVKRHLKQGTGTFAEWYRLGTVPANELWVLRFGARKERPWVCFAIVVTPVFSAKFGAGSLASDWFVSRVARRIASKCRYRQLSAEAVEEIRWAVRSMAGVGSVEVTEQDRKHDLDYTLRRLELSRSEVEERLAVVLETGVPRWQVESFIDGLGA